VRCAAGAVVMIVAMAVSACAPVVMAPGPRLMEPALDAESFTAADGAVLPLRAWVPKSGQPHAVILALHGFNDYGRFFDAPGTWLAEQGIASYAYDQRGFGGAPGRGLWPGTEALTADVWEVAAALRAANPDVPLVLLGESMGGTVAMVATTGAEPPPVDGLILVAPAVWARATMPWYQTAALWVASRTVPWLRVTGRGLGRVPSDNVPMLKALSADPLVIKETRIDAIHGLVDLMDAALEAAPRLSVPMLVLYGQRDEIIPKAPTRRMLASLPPAALERHRVAIYESGYHMLLRDLQADVVWRDIVHWVVDPAAPLPSGADTPATVGNDGRRLSGAAAMPYGADGGDP